MEQPFDDEYWINLNHTISTINRIAERLKADIKAKKSSGSFFFPQLETAWNQRKYHQIKIALMKIKKELIKMLSLLDDHNDETDDDHDEVDDDHDDEDDEYDAYILWDKYIDDKDFPGYKGFFSEDEFPGYDEKYRHVISHFTLPWYHKSDDHYDDESHDDNHDDESQDDNHDDESQDDNHDDDESHDDNHDDESQDDNHDDDESQDDNHDDDESQDDNHDDDYNDYLAMLYEETMDPRGNGNDYYYDD